MGPGSQGGGAPYSSCIQAPWGRQHRGHYTSVDGMAPVPSCMWEEDEGVTVPPLWTAEDGVNSRRRRGYNAQVEGRVSSDKDDKSI